MSGKKGTLRVYLGAAPGVGKTFAMLDEGHRRQERGADVVVAYVECHGRPKTEHQLVGLEVVPRAHRTYRGTEQTELDLDAVLARAPELALVDELAHTNVAGGKNENRWQDVQDMLAAGIDVLTTVNVQHLESLNDVVQRVTGTVQRETVPDSVVRAADQIELVDMSPEALRRRMAHGNIYRPGKVDAALANYFRVGNLTALRELALLWLADRVEEGLQRYRTQHAISDTWETRERVVVAVTGGPEGKTLIRRAARIASRSHGGDLLAVHVSRGDGLAGSDPAGLAQQRLLVEKLGGTWHNVVGDDVSAALLDFARAENATQLVLGASRRGRLAHILTGPGIGATTTRISGDIDVHMVTHDQVGAGRLLPSLRGGLSRRRRLAGLLLAAALLPLMTVAFTGSSALALNSEILLYLVAVVAVALVGGLLPALVAAVVASLLTNYYFTPPVHTFTIQQKDNLLALVVFVLVAVAVSSVVDLAARRTRQARRAGAEAEILSNLAGSVLRGDHALPTLLEQLRETFLMKSVALVRKDSDGHCEVRGFAGEEPTGDPGAGEVTAAVGETDLLVLRGRALPAADHRLLGAFAARAATALEQERLAGEAARAGQLAESDRVRAALLAAVSHDLRSPLASAKAAVSSLRDDDVSWSADDVAQLLVTADESLDRLIALVENLLDMSRVQAGALPVFRRPVALDEAVPVAVDALGEPAATVDVQVAADLPEVLVDPGLLERILVNLLANSLRHAPSQTPPTVTASALDDRVEVRLVDRGPGVREEDREAIFVPFQRLGDRDNTTGVGLGLALSRGLAEAMGGTLTTEDTPGGGLTMLLTLPVAPADEPVQAARP